MITRRRFMSGSATGLAFAAMGAASQVPAQVAGRNARMLVGFPPGGSADFVARLLVNELKDYASSIVVENRPGATGRIALDGLRTSAADGSTMVLTPASTIVLYPHIYKALKYDAFQDFIPVSTVCSFPYLISIGPMVPGHVKSLADFIAWCRANPSQATYGTPGPGSPLHFTGVTLARIEGFEFIQVPYQGGAPAVQSLLGGQIAATILPIDSTLPHIQSGKIRALVTTGPQRSTLLPDVPTIKEAGYPALEAIEWFGVFLPARTPAEAVRILAESIRAAMMKNEVKAGLARLSYEVAVASGADFARLIKSDFERWGPIVKASGFAPED
jgi:tripartite-type tricarboxylate transporter receptor subunit TctC